jgi:hypothetical protein
MNPMGTCRGPLGIHGAHFGKHWSRTNPHPSSIPWIDGEVSTGISLHVEPYEEATSASTGNKTKETRTNFI